jgi:hypothetical protein
MNTSISSTTAVTAVTAKDTAANRMQQKKHFVRGKPLS